MTQEHSIRRGLTAIGPEQASRMLRVGLAGPERPIDRLLDRLSDDDGAAWLRDVLSDGALAILDSVVAARRDRTVTVEALTTLKEQCKSAVVGRRDPEASLRAMVGYFFAIAAAIAVFGTIISSRGADELEPILTDLASVTPPDWSSVFERALSVVSEAP